MNKLLKSLLITGVMSTAGVAAFAQAGPGAMGQEGHGWGMHQRDPAKMEQMAARHLADLKAKLKITAAQEGAWSTFAAAMKPTGEMMAKRPDRAEMDKLTMPERMDKMRALRKERMAAMDANMDKHEDAAKALYAVLTPEQKKIADAEHGKMMGRHQGGADRKGAMPGAAKPAPAPAPAAKP